MTQPRDTPSIGIGTHAPIPSPPQEGGTASTNREPIPPASASTRARLLEAAIRVFARRGYHGATVDDIVAESGTSKGSFYFYFPSKEALFLSLVESFAERMAVDIQQAVQAASGAQAKVEAALTAGIGTFARYPDLARVYLVEAAGASPAFEKRRRELSERFCQLIQGYLDMAVRDGDIPQLDTEVAAHAIFGAINEVVVHHLSEPGAAPLEQVVPELARFILRGSGWQVSP